MAIAFVHQYLAERSAGATPPAPAMARTDAITAA
jgi:hypothetical protein